MEVGERLLTLESLADRLPSRPVLTMTDSERWGSTLQRFRHPPDTIEISGLRNELLVDHLVGRILVEEHAPGQRNCRRTGSGQVSVTPARDPFRRVL